MPFNNEHDENGQPLNKSLCSSRVSIRTLDEFVGFCKGIIADERIDEKEVSQLLIWLRANKDYLTNKLQHNYDTLISELTNALLDGKIDQNEQKNLYIFLQQIINKYDVCNNDFIGLTRGLVANEILSEKEILYLLYWLRESQQYSEEYPVNVIYKRIQEMLADNMVDKEEQNELKDLLTKVNGGQLITDAAPSLATTLPVNDPQPDIKFSNKIFVLTGTFAYATRDICQEEIYNRGGTCSSNVNGKTNYLVIGSIGSRDWKNSSFGRKIEQAVEYKNQGKNIIIVSETHWTQYL